MEPSDCPSKLLNELGAALRAEMNRYGLYNQVPSAIGYDLWKDWNDDAFKDLLYECYIQAILKQLPKLQAHIKLGQNIDGIIIKNVHYFIIGKFRSCDRVGYTVAANAKQSVQLSITRKILKSNDEPNNINNNTFLTFLDCKSTTSSEEEAISSALGNNSEWTTELQLKFSSFKNKDTTKEKFSDIVCRLKDFNIDSFWFRNLVDAMKKFVRRAVENRQAENIPPDFYQDKIFPDDEYENYNYFSDLCKQIKQAIDESNYKNDVREQLHRVFTEIELFIKQRKDYPSQAEIAIRLNISAATFHGYIKKLRKLIAPIRSNSCK